MAIKDEIQRIIKAKEDFKTKLIEKGVTVSDDELISDYPPKLDLIKGGTDTTDATATANEIRKGFTAYIASGKVEGAIEDYDGAFEILSAEAEFIATPSLVYTLSSDGTYYIVGTGFTDLATLEENCKSIYVNDNGTIGSGLNSSWNGGKLNIPNTYNGLPVLAIASKAFQDITNITEVNIQDGITLIGSNVLTGCISIEKLTLPFLGRKKEIYTDASQPCNIGYIFGSMSTTHVGTILPTNLKEIKLMFCGYRSNQFQYLNNLMTLTILDGIEVLSPSAFANLKNLTKIVLPSNIKDLGGYAFNGCFSLPNVNLSNVEIMRTREFQYCYSLIQIIISHPTIVCSLNSAKAFDYAYHYNGTVNETYNPTGAKDGYIYVPDSLVDSYKSATNWAQYADQIKPLSELEE